METFQINYILANLLHTFPPPLSQLRLFLQTSNEHIFPFYQNQNKMIVLLLFSIHCWRLNFPSKSIFSKLVISATCWHRVILSSTKKNFKVSRILQNIWNVCLYSMNYYLIFLGIQTDSKIFNLFNLFISKLFFVATQYLFSSETEKRNMINNIKQNLHKILKLPSHIRTSWAL